MIRLKIGIVSKFLPDPIGRHELTLKLYRCGNKPRREHKNIKKKRSIVNLYPTEYCADKVPIALHSKILLCNLADINTTVHFRGH